jgi:hypothetical protein
LLENNLVLKYASKTGKIMLVKMDLIKNEGNDLFPLMKV